VSRRIGGKGLAPLRRPASAIQATASRHGSTRIIRRLDGEVSAFQLSDCAYRRTTARALGLLLYAGHQLNASSASWLASVMAQRLEQLLTLERALGLRLFFSRTFRMSSERR